MGMIIDMTLTEFILYSQKVSEFAPLHSRLHTVFDGGRLGETEEARLLVVMIKYTFSK